MKKILLATLNSINLPPYNYSHYTVKALAISNLLNIRCMKLTLAAVPVA